MKEEHIKNLIENYKKGLTSLEENKIRTPANLNERLWDSFEKKIENRKPKIKLRWLAVASIIVFLSFYVSYTYNLNLEEQRKEALFEEAKNMFSETYESPKIESILFEDETLIVYTKIKK